MVNKCGPCLSGGWSEEHAKERGLFQCGGGVAVVVRQRENGSSNKRTVRPENDSSDQRMVGFQRLEDGEQDTECKGQAPGGLLRQL